MNEIFAMNSMLLKGKTIVITRAQEQQGEAHALFSSEGAKILDLPALVIGPPDEWGELDDALEELEHFHWIIFSSSNGVKAVDARLKIFGKTLARRSKHLKIAAVGRKTAITLANLGASPDFVPPNFVADSLIDHFPMPVFGLKMLIPRVQTGGRSVLSESFRKAGAMVVEAPAYESSCPKDMPVKTVKAFINKEVNAIVFSSGKTVAHTAKLMFSEFGENWLQLFDSVNLISIGPQTSITCKKYFHRVDREANPHDLQGLLNACIFALTNNL